MNTSIDFPVRVNKEALVDTGVNIDLSAIKIPAGITLTKVRDYVDDCMANNASVQSFLTGISSLALELPDNLADQNILFQSSMQELWDSLADCAEVIRATESDVLVSDEIARSFAINLMDESIYQIRLIGHESETSITAFRLEIIDGVDTIRISTQQQLVESIDRITDRFEEVISSLASQASYLALTRQAIDACLSKASDRFRTFTASVASFITDISTDVQGYYSCIVRAMQNGPEALLEAILKGFPFDKSVKDTEKGKWEFDDSASTYSMKSAAVNICMQIASTVGSILTFVGGVFAKTVGVAVSLITQFFNSQILRPDSEMAQYTSDSFFFDYAQPVNARNTESLAILDYQNRSYSWYDMLAYNYLNTPDAGYQYYFRLALGPNLSFLKAVCRDLGITRLQPITSVGYFGPEGVTFQEEYDWSQDAADFRRKMAVSMTNHSDLLYDKSDLFGIDDKTRESISCGYVLKMIYDLYGRHHDYKTSLGSSSGAVKMVHGIRFSREAFAASGLAINQLVTWVGGSADLMPNRPSGFNNGWNEIVESMKATEMLYQDPIDNGSVADPMPQGFDVNDLKLIYRDIEYSASQPVQKQWAPQMSVNSLVFPNSSFVQPPEYVPGSTLGAFLLAAGTLVVGAIVAIRARFKIAQVKARLANKFNNRATAAINKAKASGESKDWATAVAYTNQANIVNKMTGNRLLNYIGGRQSGQTVIQGDSSLAAISKLVKGQNDSEVQQKIISDRINF